MGLCVIAGVRVFLMQDVWIKPTFKSENWFIDDGVTAMAETSP